MNIKKQLRNLYLYEIISGFQIVDAVWVLFLLQRGFSLAQVGVAEGFFHVVSMCCEIPSGMLSDMMGRRKTLILSGIISAAGSFCMIATDYFWVILIAMGLNAFSYNLVSGTREALTYDSLLEGGQEERYLTVSSTQENIYLGIFAMTNLLSVVTVAFGYRKAYFISIVQGILSSFVAMRLSEANVGRENKKEKLTCADIRRELILYTGQSLEFLKNNPSVCRRMMLGGIVAAGCYVVNMMMQEHLVSCGLKAGWIGRHSAFMHFTFQYGRSSFRGENGAGAVKEINVCGKSGSRFFYRVKQQPCSCSFRICGRYGSRSGGSFDASDRK